MLAVLAPQAWAAPASAAEPTPAPSAAENAPEQRIVAWLNQGGGSDTIETADDPFSRMTAPVMINGQGPHYFVVDTGANQSVISTELATALGLPAGPPMELNGVASLETTPSVMVERLDIGGRVESGVRMAVLPQSAIGATGILGVDRFRQRRITLDFKNRQLIVDPPYQRTPAFSVRVPAVKRGGQLMIVNADLAGIKLSAFLDSGAERTIGNPALLQLATDRRPTTRFFEVPVVSVTGRTLQGQIAMLPVLTLGGLTLSNITITFADLHIFRIWKLTKPSLLIGVDAMSRFDGVTLDFKRSEVIFQMRPDQVGPADRVSVTPESASRIPRN